MKQGTFFFISDDFFSKHDPDGRLMKNKEGFHDRPCFYAFSDTKIPDIMWCVPISSQIDKFERIAKRKIAKQIERGNKNPKCNTIRFGNVLGQKRAFLIQNMFPVAATYVTGTYIDKNTGTPVKIDRATEKDVATNARDILKLVFRGYNNLVFSDIQKTYADLTAELQPEQQKKTEIAATAQPQTAADIFKAARDKAARINGDADRQQPDKGKDKGQEIE